MATYVTYEDLFGQASTLEEFRQLLTKFQRSKVLYLCSLINCLITKWHGAYDKSAHDELASVAFKPLLLNELNAESGTYKRVIFHRLQTLFVAKEAALYGSGEGIDPLILPHWGGLGEAFLMANDHLQPPICASNQPLQRLTQYLALNEYSFPCDLRSVLARGNLTLTKFLPPPSSLNVPELFYGASGIPLDYHRVMCSGLLCQHLLWGDKEANEYRRHFAIKSDFFANTTIPQSVVDTFLKEMSFDVAELVSAFQNRNEGLLDFTPFRNRPLMRTEGAYCPVDMRFLTEKLEAGVFWKVADSLEKKDRLALHRVWGDGFEGYVNWLLEQTMTGVSNRLLPRPTYEGTPEEVTDAIVLCGNKVVFLECKAAMMRSETKYAGRAADLALEIEKKLIKSPDRGQAVQQLARAINTVFDKRNPRSVRGLDLKGIHTVYPVVLTKDSLGGSIGLSQYLRGFFKPLIKQKELSITVAPVFCLSIDQLEEISDVMSNISLAELLNGWWRRDRMLATNFLMATDTGVRTKTRSIPSPLSASIDQLLDEAIQTFPSSPAFDVTNSQEGGECASAEVSST